MRKNRVKLVTSLAILISIITIGTNAYAHSGRTDSAGGHKDNKNASGLGSYHYHCGGNPAHLHPNGICPYSSNQGSTSSSSQSSTSSLSDSSTSNNASSLTPTTIVATEIKINEEIETMEIGENKKLTATITPDNVTDKSITWKSSNEEIVTVTENGEITAKQSGTVEITASTKNGKTNTVKVTIKEKLEIDDNNTISVSSTTVSGSTNNAVNSNLEDSNPAGGIITLGLLGGGGYWLHKKRKNSKMNK